MRHPVVFAASLLLLAACQGTNTVPVRVVPQSSAFSAPNVSAGKGPPAQTWIFAANGEGGNIDVYDAGTLSMISQCVCTGVGLAVAPGTNDLAVGSRTGTVTVWHVKGGKITHFATLNLSQGPYAIGLAYDKKGDLYAGNAGDNVIDVFDSSVISAGGGNPTRTLFTSNLNEVYYLATAGKKLLADGYNRYGQPILVSVDTLTGADTILQSITSGQLPEGIVTDRHQNLIINTPGNPNAILVFKKPWTGSPTVTFDYGSGAQTSYYSGISLDKSQDTLWAANFTLQNISHGATNVQANSYPLGTIGNATAPIASEYYDSIAVDPQAR